MASVNSLPIRTLFSRSTSFKWENIRSTDTCVQGKQLMIRDTGCKIKGYIKIISKTFGSFNLPSRSTSTSGSANAVISDFADAVADASVPAVECKEFNTHQSQLLMLFHFRLSQFLHQHLLFRLKCFECARKLIEERSLHVVAPGCSTGFSIEHQPIKKENKMIISRYHKSVNPNVTNTLDVILNSNKIKCTNTYQYWVKYNINKNIDRSSPQLSQQTLLTQTLGMIPGR